MPAACATRMAVVAVIAPLLVSPRMPSVPKYLRVMRSPAKARFLCASSLPCCEAGAKQSGRGKEAVLANRDTAGGVAGGIDDDGLVRISLARVVDLRRADCRSGHWRAGAGQRHRSRPPLLSRSPSERSGCARLQMTIIPLVAALLVMGIAQMIAAARAGATARRMLGWVFAMLVFSGLASAVLHAAAADRIPDPRGGNGAAGQRRRDGTAGGAGAGRFRVARWSRQIYLQRPQKRRCCR